MNQPPPNPYGPPSGHAQGYGPPPGYGPGQPGYGPPGYGPQPPYQPPPPPKKNNNGLIAAGLIIGVLAIAVGVNVAKQRSAPTTTVTEAPAERVAQEKPKERSVAAEKPTPPPPPPAKPIEVTAAKLYQDYDANEVAADDTYKGKRLHVTGTVSSVDKFAGDIIVHLASENEFLSVSLYDVPADTAKKLVKGQTFGATCRCDGKVMSPVLRKCEGDGLHGNPLDF